MLRHQVGLVRRAMFWTVLTNLVAVALGTIGLASDSVTATLPSLRFLTVASELTALLAMLRLVWFFVALLSLHEVDDS